MQIGKFTKLYGTSVIEAHRLLKNSIDSDQYLIISDSLLNNIALANHSSTFENRLCETYNQMESICFTWLGFTPEPDQEKQLVL